jgi:hypothetical protein
VESPEPDYEPDPELLERIERVFEAMEAAKAEAIARLYGTLADQLPKPVLRLIRQALDSLRNAGQSTERIVAIVEAARRDKYDVPGSARDADDFIKSADYLGHVQWALEQGKERALEELAGERAARDYRRSKDGREAQYAARVQELPDGHPLKGVTIEERDQHIRKEAAALQAAHPNLKISDVKRRLADWSHLSKKQVGRILSEP